MSDVTPPPDDLEGQSAEVEVPILDVPPPPADLPYAELEDYRQRELLRANGQPVEGDVLLARLADIPTTLLSAALHTLGTYPVLSEPEVIRAHLDSTDDAVRVEAAYALARHGNEDGHAALVELLGLDPVGFLAPPIAAGHLAKLGDFRGFPVVRRCLSQELLGPRMLGCKQLTFFVPAHGTDDGRGTTIDVWAAFDRALHDPDDSVAWQARVQLRDLDDPEAVGLLRDDESDDSEGKG